MQDPNEDTDWNDVLRDFGIIPPKKEEKDETEEMVLKMQTEAAVKPYEKMNLDDLKKEEDTFQEEDERAIEMYRQQRIKELKALQKTPMYGELIEIPGNQYVKEVTNAKEDVWVVIHLYRSCIQMCGLINNHLGILAKKFPETKFLKATADSCIHSYQDACLPALFIYRNGQIKGTFIGVDQCGGMNVSPEGCTFPEKEVVSSESIQPYVSPDIWDPISKELEWKLTEVGAITSDLEEDPRQKFIDLMMTSVKRSSIHRKDDDSD